MLKQKVLKVMCLTSVVLALPVSTALATTGEIDGNAVRLRKGPSTDSKIITLLEKGKEVEILDKKDEFYNVKVGNNEGWVAEKLVLVEEKVENKTQKAETDKKEDAKILAVTGSNVNLRQGPATNTTIVGKVVKGDNLISYGTTPDGLWHKVKFANTEGYIFSQYVTTDNSQILGEGTINDAVNFRKEPTTSSEIIDTLASNSKIKITGSEGEWYKVVKDGQEGWVVARCVDRVTATSRSGSNSIASKIISIAKQQLGKRYVWGANGPSSFDCSGLTKYVYGKVGVTLERVSANQATQGIKVSKSRLQPADLVFFSGINSRSKNARVSHVGIYIGNGKFLHAANSKRGVVIDELDSDYYSTHYVTARRVIR